MKLENLWKLFQGILGLLYKILKRNDAEFRPGLFIV